jgi:D-erythrulose 1-phosphate 3-epimerase
VSGFGVNLSFAVKRWPEPEAWAAFVRDELGVDLVQFTFDLLDPWWPEELATPLARRCQETARTNGLTIHSAFVGLAAYTYNALLHPEPAGREAARRWYRRAIDRAAEMGVRSVGGPVGAISVRGADRPSTRRERYEALLQTLRELTEHAAGRGLESLLIEPTPLPREIPWTPREALDLLADLGATAIPVRYCLDVGHALYRPLYGEDARLEPWFDALAEHVAMVHLQQTDGTGDSHWGFTRSGIVEPAQVARLMHASGVRAPLVLEVFYPFELSDAEVAADVSASVAYCKDQLTRA